jgi:hypothetical protein
VRPGRTVASTSTIGTAAYAAVPAR